MTGRALVALVLLLPSPARTFADTCVERESGDIGGHIVTLLGPAARSRVAFSWAEGSLQGPVVVPAIRRGTMLSFRVPIDSGVFRFSGQASGKRLTGTLVEPWDGRPHAVTLVEQPAEQAARPTRRCPASAR